MLIFLFDEAGHFTGGKTAEYTFTADTIKGLVAVEQVDGELTQLAGGERRGRSLHEAACHGPGQVIVLAELKAFFVLAVLLQEGLQRGLFRSGIEACGDTLNHNRVLSELRQVKAHFPELLTQLLHKEEVSRTQPELRWKELLLSA